MTYDRAFNDIERHRVGCDKPRLTIAIPTYNFGPVIGDTLASIASNLCDGVEILIVDAASTDATAKIVADWSRRLPIRYHRKATRDGIDIDVALCVALSRADYCWLLSADDTVASGAIAAVITNIAVAPDVMLLSHSDCDVRMRVIRSRHPVLTGRTRLIEIATTAERYRYFTDALTTEALFSFLSGLVVRRETWKPDVSVNEFRAGSCWSHAVRLLTQMRDDGLKILFVANALVNRRGENDSFAGNGIITRYALGIEGYRSIISEIFGDAGPEYQATLRILRAEFTVLMFLYAKRAAIADADRENIDHLNRMFETLYPNRVRFVVARWIYGLPTHAVILAVESVNAIRHRFLRRATK